jgi:hypothetical protein
VLDEVLAAGEVAVETGRGHPHLAGDGAQCEPVHTLVDEHPPGRRLDLTHRVGTRAVAPAHQRLGRFRHVPSRILLTSVNTVSRVTAVS